MLLARFVLIVFLPLAGLACGGGDDDGADADAGTVVAEEPTTTTATTVATTTTTAAPAPLTTQSIIDAFAAAGLPVGEVETYDEVTDPNELLGRPGQYVAN